MTAPPLLPERVKSLAIIAPTWVGDLVMATPVFRAARTALPEARICCFVQPGLDELLAGFTHISAAVSLNMKGLAGPLRTALAMRRERPDAVLILPNSFRSALAARLSGVRTRVGYNRDGRGFLLTHRLHPGDIKRPQPLVDYYNRLAQFALPITTIVPQLELSITPDQQLAGDALLRDVLLPQQRLIVLNPGANRIDKRWPADRFAQVADTLASRHTDLVLAVTGSPAERTIVDAVLAAATSPIINLQQRSITLGSLKAVLARAALLITNDTGPRHIAAALRTPIVSLFGPTDHRWTILPNVNEHQLLAQPFLPEELSADQYHKACDIARITPADVIAAAEGLLDSPRNSSPSVDGSRPPRR